MEKHKRVDRATGIFAEHGSAIRSMIRQHVTCQEEEDEVYQNLYLSLVCNPPPETLTNVMAYLNTVIRNDVIDAVRQRRSRQQMVSQYALSRPRDEVADAPDERVTQAEQVQRIKSLVGKLLPAHEARAVIDRYVYGLSMTEIAEHLRVEERTASRYACVGIRRIRDVVFRGYL